MITLRTPRSAFRTLALVALALAPACAGSGLGGSQEEDDVPWLVRHGRYDEALELAAERHADRPDDPRAQEEHRRASAAWLLERGRRLYFAGRDEEALEVFREARLIAPEEPAVEGWIRATIDRLADSWFARGIERHNDGDFDGAIEAYETALRYEPGHQRSRETLARALVQQNYRRGMGEDYYDDGIVALDRYFLYEARSLFSYVLKYEPENERAERRGERAQELLADERAAKAAELEEEGVFAAARNEYRLALLLDPEMEAARAGMERMAREEGVAEVVRQAERMLLQQRFDKAVAMLEEARPDTDRQSERIDGILAAVHGARLDAMYQAARTLESDWRYEAAAAAYGALLESEPFFRDAIARKDTLESYVQEARELYALFETAGTDEERLSALRRIAVFWPEYRDVGLRLAELEARVPDGR